MGGCRCAFRDCKVATVRNPNMHFFHFPLKDKERLAKWLKMAAAEHIMEKSTVYRKNRVVCAQHFRDENFMNYKKDRLVQNAVPTLMRLSRYLAMDYDLEQPKLVRLEKPTMPHLIAPADFQDPFEFLDDESVHIDVLDEPNDQATESCATKIGKRQIPAETHEHELADKRPKLDRTESAEEMALPTDIAEEFVEESTLDSVIIMESVDMTNHEGYVLYTPENGDGTIQLLPSTKSMISQHVQTDMELTDFNEFEAQKRNLEQERKVRLLSMAHSKQKTIKLAEQLQQAQEQQTATSKELSTLHNAHTALQEELLALQRERDELQQTLEQHKQQATATQQQHTTTTTTAGTPFS